jgi:uncharacterized membrane protein YGL010W
MMLNKMKSFIEQAQFYASYHQKVQTRYTHMAGVPLIILSFMILLGFVKIIIPGYLQTNFACVGTVIILIYYFRLNWQLSLVLTPIMFILLLIANWFSQNGPTKFGMWSFIIFFVLGLGLQFYGHYLEGKKPAFMDNLTQSFIAPLYLVAELFFMAGLMQSLKEQIYGPVPTQIEP